MAVSISLVHDPLQAGDTSATREPDVNDEQTQPAALIVPVVLPWRRALWVAVAAVMALAGLWDSRALLLGNQPAARAVALPSPPPVPSAEITARTGSKIVRGAHALSAGNGLVSVKVDLGHGRVSLSWPATAQLPAVTLAGGVASLQIQGMAGSGAAGAVQSADYAHHSVSTAPFADSQGSGLLVTVRHEDSRYPPLMQEIRIYRDSPSLLLSATIGNGTGQPLTMPRFDPLVVDGTGTIAVPGNTNPLVLAVNGLTADHMPRQYAPLAALPMQVPLPYLTTLAGAEGGQALLAGAVSMTGWFPAVRLDHGVEGISALALSSTGPTTGRKLQSETFMLGRYADNAAALHAYAANMARRSDAAPESGDAVQIGWSSWGAYEQVVSQARVRRNVDFMAAHLRALGYSLVHIDDGWQRAYGDWEAGPSFPAGMQEMAEYIHARGLRASIWLAPFLTSPNAWPAREHPDWLLRNPDGSPIQVMISSPTVVLDASNPQVLDYLRAVCARIRDWGFDEVKLDFLYAGALEGQRYRFDLNGIQAYTAAMRVIHNTLEADPHHPIYLIGVQQGFLPAGLFQGWRVGRDIESKTNADHIPTWDLVRREALAISTFAFASGILYGTDPDDLLLRHVTGAHNLSDDESQTYATMVALGGGIWLSGDDLPGLAAQGRLSYLTNPEVLAVVRAGRAGMPVDLADQVTGPASIWSAPQPDGSVAVGIFNWTDSPRKISVSPADLGLSAGRRYDARDLWARRDLAHVTGDLSYTLRPHQSLLLRLIPLG
jgi:hypothetical protein